MNEIVHIWALRGSAPDRTKRRAAMAADPAWQAYLQKSREFMKTMNNKILVPTSFLTHEVREKHGRPSHPRRSGAQVLIDQLRIHGTDTIFGVPGESYLAALDALYAQRNSIRYIICRQEGGASNMAEAYGKLTGKPGIAFVTRGPGATNASIGLHTGFQDLDADDPAGRPGRARNHRPRGVPGDRLSPHVRPDGQVGGADRAMPARIPELVSQAFHRALNGRPGPVVVALPEDMLIDEVEVADAGPYKIARGAPSADDMATLARACSRQARQPMVILGGGGWSAEACADIQAFVEANGLPVAPAFRNQDLFDNRHPNYRRRSRHRRRTRRWASGLKDSDLILAIGPRLGEATTGGYTLFELPVPRAEAGARPCRR